MLIRRTKDQLRKVLLDDKLKREKRISAQDLYNIIAIVCETYGWSFGANVGTRNITSSMWELDEDNEN